ncbi:hypothetical protein MBM09_10275 [Flaviramulus sp. BrNp1-15]|uniref:hypothetical protein n=1 Tax=Flaviramulus sp. BrNp1-15 TaxID=2916754 RepID=UPI001EE7A32A|nr:hypothetical protein [Flaviramulus sp. BrNp1-15]ULC58306.1 hypothetical protein MBM09_10275 [Flaviramulus sp. BrNp1-15]
MKILLITLILISCQTKGKKKQIEIKESEKKIEKKVKQTSELINNGEYFKVRLFHPETEIEFDSIVSKEFLKDDLFTLLEFNYPKFKSKLIDENSVELLKGNTKIVIKTSEFKKDNRELSFDSSETFLEKIDGKDIYGTDGNIPRKEISSFYLIVNDEKIEIPQEQYNDLFEPTIECLNDNDDLYCYTVGYLNEKGEIILTMQNSDGAGSYMVIFLFDKKNKIKERIIGYQF